MDDDTPRALVLRVPSGPRVVYRPRLLCARPRSGTHKPVVGSFALHEPSRHYLYYTVPVVEQRALSALYVMCPELMHEEEKLLSESSAMESDRNAQEGDNANETLTPSAGQEDDLQLINSTRTSPESGQSTPQSRAKAQTPRTQQGSFRIAFRHMCSSLALLPTDEPESPVLVALGFSSGEVVVHNMWQKAAPPIVLHHSPALSSHAVTHIAFLPPPNTNIVVVVFDDRGLYFFNRKMTKVAPLNDGDVILEAVNASHAQLGFHTTLQEDESSNPRRKWTFSAPVTALAAHPSEQLLAVGTSDGKLRVCSITEDRTRYGAVTCAAWSPNGDLLLTGGADDCVCLYRLSRPSSPEHGKSVYSLTLLARGSGHRSFVAHVAFDEYTTAEDGSLRVASVGEDGRLFVWLTPSLSTATATLPSSVPVLALLGTILVSSIPCSSVVFLRDALATASWGGQVVLWSKVCE